MSNGSGNGDRRVAAHLYGGTKHHTLETVTSTLAVMEGSDDSAQREWAAKLKALKNKVVRECQLCGKRIIAASGVDRLALVHKLKCAKVADADLTPEELQLLSKVRAQCPRCPEICYSATNIAFEVATHLHCRHFIWKVMRVQSVKTTHTDSSSSGSRHSEALALDPVRISSSQEETLSLLDSPSEFQRGPDRGTGGSWSLP